MFFQEHLLVVYHLLQGSELLCHGRIALHRTVVNATHAYGEDIVLRALHLLQPFSPILVHLLLVGTIVERPPLGYFPLINIIAEQGLAMRRSDDNTT